MGVTNDRLDEVSNYYRFRPQQGELWKTAEAKGHAVVEGGKVTKVVITEAGSDCTPPQVTIQGLEKVTLSAKLHFVKDLKKNGGIEAVEVVAGP